MQVNAGSDHGEDGFARLQELVQGSGAAPPRLLPRPAPGRTRPRGGARTVVVGGSLTAGLLALVTILGITLSGGTSPSTSPSTSQSDEATEVAPGRGPIDPCPGAPIPLPAGAVTVPGDPSGTGCTVAVVWWPDRAEAERPEPSGARTRFALGDPGDQLLLGDWDGDGRDTPGLYDPRRGEVVRFDAWASAGETLTGRITRTGLPTDGVAEVQHRSGGDTVGVRPATQSR